MQLSGLSVLLACMFFWAFSYLGRGADGLIAGEPGIPALNLVLAILYAGAALTLAVICLNRKGVVRP